MGLFVCYDVSGLPSTNNALEGFFGRENQSTTYHWTQSVNNFVLRYGSLLPSSIRLKPRRIALPAAIR
ncbi:hypothetical protein KFU94_36435 [Chloroflexi bacterium TSY]|nr:hypothetical protein [Chloroflexi bacterium TSY]